MSDAPVVFVVDDDPGALRSLCWLIQQAELPVRPFASGEAFLVACRPDDAGCLVLDVRMPDLGGLDLQERLCQRGIQLPIIFITAYGDVPACAKAFRAGAFDFLEKPVDGQILLERVRKAIAEDALRRQHGSSAGLMAKASQLSPREKQVLEMLTSGKSLKQIAIDTNVTVQTAWRHRRSVFKKLGVENEVQLVRAVTQWTYLRRP